MKNTTTQMKELYESARAKLAAAEADHQAKLEAMLIEFAPKDGEEFDANVAGDRIAKRGWAAWSAEVLRRIIPEDYCTAEECDAYYKVADAELDDIFAQFCGDEEE